MWGSAQVQFSLSASFQHGDPTNNKLTRGFPVHGLVILGSCTQGPCKWGLCTRCAPGCLVTALCAAGQPGEGQDAGPVKGRLGLGPMEAGSQNFLFYCASDKWNTSADVLC